MTPETPMIQKGTTSNEHGYVAIVTALMIIPLMGFVAFAVDLGLWYNEAAQIQRASDAAALAGVVVLPDLAAAQAEAEEVARRNGYEVNDPNIQVIVNETGPLQLSVDIIDTDIDLVFSSFFIDNVDITRDSTAQYIKPIPLGSPANSFGNPSIAEALNPTSTTPQVWAAINAGFTRKAQGDPFSTQCNGEKVEFNGATNRWESWNACDSVNDEFRNTGYWYAIDVPVSMIGTPVTVSVFDPALNTGATQCLGNTCELTWWSYETANGFSPTVYEMRDADDSPHNWHNNPPLQQAGCDQPETFAPNIGPGAPNHNQWVVLCTFTPTTSGIYPLNVRTVDFPAGSIAAGFEQFGRGNSSQSYSLKAEAPGALQPRLYALGDMSIIVSAPAGPPPELFLMEINEAYDNKKVEIELFDAGEAYGISFLEFMVPDGVGGNQMAPKCTVIDDANNETVLTPCKVMVSNSNTTTRVTLYNNRWLRVVIDTSDIDPTGPYVCGTNCWWKVRYNLNTNNVPAGGSGTTDRTTWRAQVIGDPLALID